MMRIFANCIALGSVFFLPPYVSLLVIVACVFAFDTFVESIGWAYLLDTLYGGGGFFGIHFEHLFTVFALLVFLFSFPIKKMLKFYSVV